jgi:glycyl-tRNA synthetase beta chain
VQLRAEGARHDVLAAVFAAGADDDIIRLLARTSAVAGLLASAEGADLLTAYRRAANIVRIESRKDGPHDRPVNPDRLIEAAEIDLYRALDALPVVKRLMGDENFAGAMEWMAQWRDPLDAFFDRVTVNAPDADLRRNRLYLLNQVRATFDQVADLSKIEG